MQLYSECVGGTYAPEGSVLSEKGAPVDAPADQPCALQTAACCAVCNDSFLNYDAGMMPPSARVFF